MTKPLTLDDLARAVGDAQLWDGDHVRDMLANSEMEAIARAIITTIKEAGWKIVPVEATEEMMEAAYDARVTEIWMEAIYAAMIAAAPKIEGE